MALFLPVRQVIWNKSATFTTRKLFILVKDILAGIYFIYGMVLFAITMLPVAFILFLFKNLSGEKTFSKAVQHSFQIWMGIYMPLIFCPVKHRGRENFKKGQNYVVTLNHNSLADVPVSSPGIPGPNRTLAKIEMAGIPVFGYIYRAGSILVTRQDAQSRKESIAKMLEALEKGLHLCLFPEGTRNKTSEPLARFYDGAFKVAIEAQKPVIPGLIFGTKKILHPKKKLWARPHKIEFHFLEAIPTTGLEVKDTEYLKQKVHKIMTDYFVAHDELNR